MLTRRQFLRILAALSGTGFLPSCLSTPSATPLLPTAAATSTEIYLSRDASATPAMQTPTGTPTFTPEPTSTSSPTSSVTPTVAPTRSPDEFIAVRGDQFYYGGMPFPVKGFNYYPRLHPWRTFNIGEWEPKVTERELKLGVSMGANTVRMFVDYQFSLDNSKAQQIRENYFAPIGQYIANVQSFLDIAGRLGLRVIVTLFDSMDWVVYQPQFHWIAEEYLKELIPPFANNPDIFCWDLQNEPDRAIALVGNSSVIPFFQKMSALVRKLAPLHLQTIGWIDRARARYFPELDGLLDFWCFHFYDDANKLGDLVRFYKPKTAKPVLLEEFGLPTGGPGRDGQSGEIDQANHYRTILQTLADNRMCGSVLWTLNDFPIGLAGNPPSPNDSPENHFGVLRLDYTEKPAAMVLREFWKTNRRSNGNE